MELEPDKPRNVVAKVYKRRWFMLGLYCTSVLITTIQWVQFSVIADVVVKYYNVSFEAVNWSSLIYLQVFVVLLFPGSYFLERFGLRKGILLALLLNTIGSWIKVLAVQPDKYWLVLMGQGVVAGSVALVSCAPALMAAEWFDLSQISTACSIGVFGYQFGSAIGFIVPTIGLPTEYDSHTFQIKKIVELLSIAVISTLFLITCCFCFEDKPPTPPTARKMVHTKTSNFLKSLFALVTNSSFMLVLFACGIDLGIVTTIGTLLNQILANYYDNPSTDAGKIGLVMFFIGSMAPAVCGIILDKFKAYRLTFVVLQLCTLLTTIAFTYTLNLGIICVYVISALLGFFYTAIQLVSFETAIELTYPEPETISIGIMTATFQIGITWANNTMSALNIFAFLLVLCIRFQFKREQSHVMGYSH